uniref:Uncharacterized protein n=1 Tax=Moniliophthora roreri TaxID=221103 RepID=A0A0W0FPU9_MONRR
MLDNRCEVLSWRHGMIYHAQNCGQQS